MFCSNCGSILAEDAKFCSQCGSKVRSRNSSVPEFVIPVTEAEAATLKSEAAAPEPEMPERKEPEAEFAQREESGRFVPEFEMVTEAPEKQSGWGAEADFYGQNPTENGSPDRKKRKKNRAPVIAALLVIVLLVLAGGMIAYFSLFDDREDKGIFSVFDLTKEEKKLNEEQEEAFLELVSKWDQACQDQSTYLFKRAFPAYAHDYIMSSYGANSVPELLAWMNYLSFEQCGEDATFEEAYEIERKIRETEKLSEAIEDVTGERLKIREAYLIRNTMTVQGSENKLLITDLYLFYETEGDWNLILIKDLDDFGL